jgi:hypothetical protein
MDIYVPKVAFISYRSAVGKSSLIHALRERSEQIVPGKGKIIVHQIRNNGPNRSWANLEMNIYEYPGFKDYPEIFQIFEREIILYDLIIYITDPENEDSNAQIFYNLLEESVLRYFSYSLERPSKKIWKIINKIDVASEPRNGYFRISAHLLLLRHIISNENSDPDGFVEKLEEYLKTIMVIPLTTLKNIYQTIIQKEPLNGMKHLVECLKDKKETDIFHFLKYIMADPYHVYNQDGQTYILAALVGELLLNYIKNDLRLKDLYLNWKMYPANHLEYLCIQQLSALLIVRLLSVMDMKAYYGKIIEDMVHFNFYTMSNLLRYDTSSGRIVSLGEDCYFISEVLGKDAIRKMNSDFYYLVLIGDTDMLTLKVLKRQEVWKKYRHMIYEHLGSRMLQLVEIYLEGYCGDHEKLKTALFSEEIFCNNERRASLKNNIEELQRFI